MNLLANYVILVMLDKHDYREHMMFKAKLSIDIIHFIHSSNKRNKSTKTDTKPNLLGKFQFSSCEESSSCFSPLQSP